MSLLMITVDYVILEQPIGFRLTLENRKFSAIFLHVFHKIVYPDSKF